MNMIGLFIGRTYIIGWCGMDRYEQKIFKKKFVEMFSNFLNGQCYYWNLIKKNIIIRATNKSINTSILHEALYPIQKMIHTKKNK